MVILKTYPNKQNISKMNLSFRKLFLAFSGLFLASACSVSKSESNNVLDATSLFGTEWKLEKIGSSKMKYDEERDRITLLMTKEPENVSGFSACNRYFGKFTIKKNKLIFKEMAATQMACPEQKMNLEDRYLLTLNKVNNYLIENDTLYLRNDERVLLIFSY